MKIISREEAMSLSEEGYHAYSISKDSIPNLDSCVYCLISNEEFQELRWSGMVDWVKKELFPSLYGTHATSSDMKKDILEERQGTHGEFAEVAEISQDLKEYFRQKAGWYDLTYVQREALDNIAQKAARIFVGDPNFADHWVDIQGYAKLAEKEIRKEENQDGPTSPK